MFQTVKDTIKNPQVSIINIKTNTAGYTEIVEENHKRTSESALSRISEHKSDNGVLENSYTKIELQEELVDGRDGGRYEKYEL